MIVLCRETIILCLLLVTANGETFSPSLSPPGENLATVKPPEMPINKTPDMTIAYWLERHHLFRSAGLPYAAGNMLELRWDVKLASQAKSQAKSECSNQTTKKSENVASKGMNAFVTYAKTKPLLYVDLAMKEWGVEKSLHVIPKLPLPKIDHIVGNHMYSTYSQIVWADSNLLGCAITTCDQQATSNNTHFTVVVCRYDPPGNVNGEGWYTYNAQAKKCPGTSQPLDGTCVKHKDDQLEFNIIPDKDRAYNVYRDYVKRVHNIISNTFSVSNDAMPEENNENNEVNNDGDPGNNKGNKQLNTGNVHTNSGNEGNNVDTVKTIPTPNVNNEPQTVPNTVPKSVDQEQHTNSGTEPNQLFGNVRPKSHGLVTHLETSALSVTTQAGNKSSSSNTSKTIIIVVAVVVAIGVLGGAAYLYLQKRRSSKAITRTENIYQI